MSETRMTIPARFYYTRLDQESVEVVLASDYDALRARIAELEDIIAQYPEGSVTTLYQMEENQRLRLHLAEANAHLEAQRTATYQAVEREHKAKQQLVTALKETPVNPMQP